MGRRRTVALVLVAAVAIAACGRSAFLGDDASPTGTPTPTLTPPVSPTPTPDSSRYPTPGPTPAIGFGNGNVDGTPTFSASAVINSCYAVSWASNDTIAFDLAPAAAPLADPHYYLLWQVQSSTLNTAGRPTTTTPVDFNGAGLWEVVQADVWDATQHHLGIHGLMNYRYRSFGIDHAQACHIPEYDNATVNSGGKIAAQRWNGRTGGVVALMVSGNLDLNNTTASLDASGAGFRGGIAGSDDGAGNGQLTTAVDSLVATTAGGKGESLDGSAWVRFASGAIGSGGGGGNNDCGAGGGGGNGGLGGFGGDEFANSPLTGGAGGAAAGLKAPSRLLLGGGGGGGATHNMRGAGGAAGGGAVLILANNIQNGGTILVTGSNATAIAGSGDGGGGGGAGGQLSVSEGSVAGHCRANGGLGGSASGGAHPSQSGGGGAKNAACPP